VRGWSYFENSNEKVTVRLLSGNRMVTFDQVSGSSGTDFFSRVSWRKNLAAVGLSSAI